MKKEQIAAQLYTVREFTKTPSDVAATLKKIRKIGYRAVQISGLGPIDYRELAKILDGEDLTVCASHDGGDEVLDTPEKVVARLQILNCRYTAYPWPHTAPATAADYRKLARRLNRAAEVFASAGIVFCYHNHAAEFVKFKDGKLGLDIIYENTDPKKFMGEIDTYWVQFGGGDCVEWCRKLHKRLPLLHLKDYRIKPITAELCQDALRDVFVKPKTRSITAEVIMQTVSDYYSITPEDLISPSRRREITVPRQIAIYLTREMTTMSLPQIGQAFGNRDHSTILHSCSLVSSNMKSSSSMASVVNDIRNLIKEGK